MALFTIEQVELIRRLKSSGITKEQVLQAFNELDRLDGEFSRSFYSDGSDYNSHVYLYNTSSPQDDVNRAFGSDSLIVGYSRPDASNSDSYMNVAFKSEYYGLQTTSRNQCSSTNSKDDFSEADIANVDCPADISSKIHGDMNVISTTSERVSNTPVAEVLTQGMCRASINCSFSPLETHSEEMLELQELKKKGDMIALNEIRNFVMAYNIKQTLIAEMTKMSQPYVSRFFRGDIQDMPERTKDVFFLWYLTCKNNPLKLAQMCPNSGVKRMVSENGDLIPLKRERFTFKGAHLSVLERYYEQDPYPDAHIREIIVEECNKAAEKSEWPLSEKDMVTLPVVNNWFNNRRKDAKKQMKLRHNSLSVIVPPSCQASMVSSVVPAASWSSCSVSSSSFPFYPDLSTEISESDSSSTSERFVDSDQNLIIDINEQESDIKQIL